MQHQAWWSGTIGNLASQPVVDHLARRLVETHVVNRGTQIEAWRRQVAILATLQAEPTWRLLLEFPLLRLGRRIDAILLTDRAIIVLEFKIGASSCAAADQMQVEDYALDLHDFHAGSRHHPIVPVLVATHASDDAVGRKAPWELCWFKVARVFCANAATLPDLLGEISRRIGPPQAPLDVAAWEQAPYAPVPTIVEAATMLFARNNVADISATRAGTRNLTDTTDAIRAAIAEAESAHRHVVVFVTGIPGAGKTLCGLNAVFGAPVASAFLTGNLPLVFVLREALARNASEGGRSKRMARQETESAIQPLMGFLRDNDARSGPPHEHVIVFDEAQRAWDAAFGRRKFGRDDSEAALFLDIMRRHSDYAVIVALVGNGQEINTGEAGLAEWGLALAARPDWSVVAAPSVFTATEPRQRLAATRPATARVDHALHLDVPVRSIRSPDGASWVDAVLRGDRVAAGRIAAVGVPFFITRSLNDMRAELRRLARGHRRAGLVCSTGARRLRADGIWPDFPHLDAEIVANWFLNRWPDDVRASDALEVPATQFACQGLELDVVGLCWGGDLIRGPGQAWLARKFKGKVWQRPLAEDSAAYWINTYRVLLTRARYETVIWVPEGAPDDPTRDPLTHDRIATFLNACGARYLTERVADEPPLELEPALL